MSRNSTRTDQIGFGWLRTHRGIAMLVVLTATWCALWQEISAANVLAGAGLAAAVLSAGIGTPMNGSIQPIALAKLLWLVFVDLVTSTVDVAKEILTPTDYTNEVIIAVPLTDAGRNHFLLLTVAVTLTPGTAVVDADPDTQTLFLHLLHAERRDDVVAHVHQLADLANQALPPSSHEPIPSQP